MRTSSFIAPMLAAAALWPTTVQAQVQQVQSRLSNGIDQSGEILAGVDYQQGDYGTGAKVETVSTSVGVAIRKGSVRLAAVVPYLRTTAPVDVVVSQGGLFGTPLLASNSSQSSRTKREGLGDATLQVAYDMPVAGFSTSVGAGMKLPTASPAKGLGTGKVDYAVNVQIARALLSGVTPFAAVGYTIVGKPDDFAVRNTVSATAGTRVALSPEAFAALSYSYEQSASQTLSERQSLGLGLGFTLGRKVQLGVQGEAGLSRGAPDMKVGLRIGAGF